VVNWGELAGFKHLDGSSYFAPVLGHGWLAIYLAFAFLLTWNVIAMEAAACYVGETKNRYSDHQRVCIRAVGACAPAVPV
jgi:hypothetical protein